MTRRLLAHLAFLLVGLVLLTWPITFGAHPRIECRGVEMHPGDVCHKAELDGTDRGRTQTYEERLASSRSTRPAVVGAGAVATAFGAYLLWSDGRRRENPGARRDPAA